MRLNSYHCQDLSNVASNHTHHWATMLAHWEHWDSSSNHPRIRSQSQTKPKHFSQVTETASHERSLRLHQIVIHPRQCPVRFHVSEIVNHKMKMLILLIIIVTRTNLARYPSLTYSRSFIVSFTHAISFDSPRSN